MIALTIDFYFQPSLHLSRMRIVRTLREIVGIDQRTLASASGVSRQALSLYENGHVCASSKVWKRIDDALQRLLDDRALEAIGAAIVERRVNSALWKAGLRGEPQPTPETR